MSALRTRLRRLGFGLSTVLGVAKRGFFIPYRYAASVAEPPRQGAYDALEPIFAAAEPEFRALLGRIDAHEGALQAIGGQKPPEPKWTQDWFPRLDAAAAYALVRDLRPARIVEVGSGHSTRFMGRAVRDGGIAALLTAIDPAPRAAIEATGFQIHRFPVQQADPAVFAGLAAGDVLFIDSSHILMPGTDVDLLFNRVLPGLPAGVHVHIHDICLPDGYPQDWAWRGYNEQLAVATLLQGGGYRLIWSSHYVATRMGDALAASAASRLKLMPGAHETSLWLVKR